MHKERKLVNFKLIHEIERMERSTCHEHGTKRKSESQMEIEPMTFQTSVECSNLATGSLVMSYRSLSVYVLTDEAQPQFSAKLL